MKIGVILSGCGVYDGSEIHEAVFTLLAIDEKGAKAICFAPDKDQYHVVDHITGEALSESRNVLKESARIARGDIRSIKEVSIDDFDALVIPGGFGAAKNLNQWAISGPDGDIDKDVADMIRSAVAAGKPVAGLCMGPTVISQALRGTGAEPTLTVGSTEEESPYDIAGISEAMKSIGSNHEMRTIREIAVDKKNKIVTAPCYMMNASISEVRANVRQAIDKLIELTEKG